MMWKDYTLVCDDQSSEDCKGADQVAFIEGWSPRESLAYAIGQARERGWSIDFIDPEIPTDENLLSDMTVAKVTCSPCDAKRWVCFPNATAVER
jgi:hypothetical protein